MAELVTPSPVVRASFVAAVEECGDDVSAVLHLVGHPLDRHPDWSTPAGFAAYVEQTVARRREETSRREGWVPDTTLWWVEAEEFLGRISLRHRLTPFLRDVGGHIGYGVRPSRRREGHATAMLAAALPVARDLGIERVLVTCDADNLASARVIERNGGVLQDEHGGKRRYWIVTGPAG